QRIQPAPGPVAGCAGPRSRYVRSVPSKPTPATNDAVRRLVEGPPDAHAWRLWERLIDERGIVIARPHGAAHPRYPDMIYPCDYGHIPGTAAADGYGVDVFAGPLQT